MDYRLEHRLPWSGPPRALLHLLYTDSRLNAALAGMRHLKQREITHLEVDEAGRHAQRQVRIELDMAVPDVFARLLGRNNAEAIGRNLAWEEHSTCDFDALRIDFNIRLPHLDDRIQAHGCYQLLPGRTQVTRQIRGQVRVDAPLVGRLAERIVVARLKENMDEEARLTGAFLECRRG